MDLLELFPAFLAGLASTLHCVGMCGPLALAAAASPARGGPWIYVASKTLSYLFLGAALALAGGLAAKATAPATVHAVTAATGTFFLAAGADMVRPGWRGTGTTSTSLPAWLHRALGWLRGTGPAAPLLLGGVSGLLPCPLSWGMAGWAAGTGHPLKGALLMVAFGLGTAPGLLAVATLGRGLRAAGRGRLRVAAGVTWVLLGAGLLVRGLGAIATGAPCH